MFSLEFERRSLPGGLVLLFHRTRRIPMVSLGIFLRAGKDQNPPALPGVSALAVRLLDEGTVRYSDRQISELIEGVGGEMSSFSEREFAGVCLELQSRHLGLGIDLLAEMVRNPVFPPARLEIERKRIASHIRSMNDDPATVASQELNRCIYGETSLGVPVLGTPDSIRAIRQQDLLEFHRRRYGPRGTIVVAVGDIESAEFFSRAEAALGDWSNPDQDAFAPVILERQKSPLTRRIALEKEQVSLFVGHLGLERSHPDFYAAQVFDVIFGGGPGLTSRIPRRIRDEQGLAYHTYADLAGSAGIYPGRFVAFIGTAPENCRAALESLVREIETIRDQGVGEDELEHARNYLTGSFVFEFQSNSSVTRFLLQVELFGLGENYAGSYPARVESITREDVHRVARLHVDPVNYTSVLAGPVSEIS